MSSVIYIVFCREIHHPYFGFIADIFRHEKDAEKFIEKSDPGYEREFDIEEHEIKETGDE